MNDWEVFNYACQESLATFTAQAFSLVEPSIQYEHNWHIDCLPYDQLILTEDGYIPIGEIVENKYSGHVLSYNHKTNKPEWKKITAHMKTCSKPLYDVISCTGEKITISGNHPIYANGKYTEAEKTKTGDRLLRVLQNNIPILQREKSSEILWDEMFWASKKRPNKNNLLYLWWKERLQWKSLQKMLWNSLQKWKRISMCKLPKNGLQTASKICRDEQEKGRVLRLQMFWGIRNWLKQYGIYRWKKSWNISSEWVQADESKNNTKRWWRLFSLQKETRKNIRCSPYRQKHKKQRTLESCGVMSEMPQSTKINARWHVDIGQCSIRSVTKSLQLSDTLYNLEVDGNNNYFVNGILVHNCIAEHLQAVHTGEIRNLIINMPPRALKTHTTSVSFPAWVLGKDPSSRFILTSFKSSLAEAMTRKTRQILRSDWYQKCFPKTRISSDMDRQYHFETTELGQYYSSSMESVTGMGGDYVLVDDPLNPNEAASDVMRLHAIETIKGTLFSRFNDPRSGRFILNMQRLHDADPTGELLKETGFYHLKLPAEAIGKSYYYSIGGKSWELKQNEMLFPHRFTREVLDKAMERLGTYNYAGQYLQDPVPLGGQELKGEWIQYYAQGAIKPQTMNVCILVDPSGGDDTNKKKGKLSDWTAMVVIGLAPDNNYYLLDIVRDRLNPTERIDTLFMLHRKWNSLTGKPPKVGYEKYGMMTDTHYIKEKQKSDAYHFPITELGGAMKKEERIRRLIPDLQNNRWYFPQSLIYVDMDGRSYDLVQEIIKSEMATFPRSRYDDMIDAISRIFDMDMIFPKPKLGMVEGAIKRARPTTSRGWKSF